MALAAGARLGPYEVVDLVGAGGMGEVYRARDPRLGRDVAVKVLPAAVAASPERQQRFEREARAVAAVNHPNVLTVFDVGTQAIAAADSATDCAAGVESDVSAIPFVVTELLQGETLRELLRHRVPTQQQVLSFAAQIARGLDAAHGHGIVHRDVKPENVFVTSDGQVKVLDFGIAKLGQELGRSGDGTTESSPTGDGQVLGTIGYMSPEQLRGLPIDHRTDIFSLGVVLYELLGGKHPFHRDSAVATVTAILEETPPELSTLTRGVLPAVSGVVRRCLEKDREQRFRSAHDLALSLEATLGGQSGSAGPREIEERSPYPGLASFTETDAAVFFGREAEVQAFWQRLQSRKLLAVIGPSGAGKTSFVRAGVVASRPGGWGAIVCTPGSAPFRGLGRALVPELSGDPEAIRALVDVDDPAVACELVGRWRRRHGEALLVVDQFEELFTLSGPETQRRFAALLGRLAGEGDLHVLLSLRDDFLIRCSEHESLAAVFQDLTPLPELGRDGLVRALVEPARTSGYRFEDEALVGEMVDAVAGARGALPLLAFAVARLWEQRDRARRLLTQEAYERIGGVGGALAQHAEATLEAIGEERGPIVRELFRNLVTAQGTRVARGMDELLSVFAAQVRDDARSVLWALVNARLLTSFEEDAAEKGAKGPRHRFEIVHESLLGAWPRLVWWQTRDAAAAQFRDQLREAARTWEEHGRADDLLWTGSAYRLYAVWREHYQGGLSELEEAFGRAMTQLADRRRRRRQLAATAAVASLLAVAAALSLLWRRSTQETRRAEGHKLVALGRVELARNPAAVIAFARASLEVVDSAEARRLAVEALWAGPPTMFATNRVRCIRPVFSPDGRRLACSGYEGSVTVFPDDGGEPLRIAGLPIQPHRRGVAFTPSGDRLLTWLSGDEGIHVFTATGEELDTLPGEVEKVVVLDDDTVATYGAWAPGEAERAVRVWSLRDHSSRLVARWRPPPDFQRGFPEVQPTDLDPRLRWMAQGDGGTVHLVSLAGPDAGREIEVGTHQGKVREVTFSPDGSRLASVDEEGDFRVWPVAAGETLRTLKAPVPALLSRVDFDASASRLGWGAERGVLVWNLADPADAAPRLLWGPGDQNFGAVAFHPEGGWAVAARISGEMFLWALASPYPRVLRGHAQRPLDLAFTGDSRFLASCSFDGVRLWPLSPESGRQRLIDLGEEYWCFDIAADATSDHLLVAAPGTGTVLVEPDGATSRKLEGTPAKVLFTGALDTRAGLAAIGVYWADEAKDMAIHVVDLGSGANRTFPLREGDTQDPWAGGIDSLGFVADGSLMSGGDGGVFRWDLATGARTRVCGEAGQLSEGQYSLVATSGSGRSMIAGCWDGQATRVLVVDPATGVGRHIPSHGNAISAVAMDATGERIATGDRSGAVRVGFATGEEPHLLLVHSDPVTAVAFSPDGRWLASASGTEIVLWPVPDLSKPPLHTLPHDELLSKLRSFTNLRAVRDETSDNGWTIEVGPFPGWREVPTW
jgi:WD40 repeat protein